jgi:hypothetical protein
MVTMIFFLEVLESTRVVVTGHVVLLMVDTVAMCQLQEMEMSTLAGGVEVWNRFFEARGFQHHSTSVESSLAQISLSRHVYHKLWV